MSYISISLAIAWRVFNMDTWIIPIRISNCLFSHHKKVLARILITFSIEARAIQYIRNQCLFVLLFFDYLSFYVYNKIENGMEWECWFNHTEIIIKWNKSGPWTTVQFDRKENKRKCLFNLFLKEIVIHIYILWCQ